MKLSKFLLIAVVTLGLAACNNENVPEVQQKDGSISLKIKQNGVSSQMKAVGDANLKTAESAIHSLDVFVFNGDEVDGYKHVDATTGTPLNQVEDIAVTVGSRIIIVVANAPESLSGIISKSALQEKIASDLADQSLDNGLLMTSEETDPIGILPGKNYYGYAQGQTDAVAEFSSDKPLLLTRVVARVALMGVTVQFEAPYADWTYQNENVFLFNAKQQSRYFGTSLVEGAEFLSGMDLTGFDGPLFPKDWESGWTADYLIDDVTDLTEITPDTPIYYYTFENDTEVSPTCLSLRGKLKDKNRKDVTRITHTQYPNIDDIVDEDGYTYFTVIVNATKVGYNYNDDPINPVEHNSTVMRNTQYNITLKITRPGVIDPTDPLEAAILNVEVDVTPWEVVDQEVIW